MIDKINTRHMGDTIRDESRARYMQASRLIRVVAFMLLLGGVYPISDAAAQDTTSTGLILPNLTPREVEIRGDLVISFPSLVRQPLIGFNPPPRVPDVAVDRRPYVTEYKQSGDDLPDSPLVKPTPPAVASLTSGEQAFGEIEAIAGNYFNRSVRVRAGYPVSNSSGLDLDIDYHGSNGSSVLTGFEDVKNEYDTFEGNLKFSHASDAFRTSVTVGGISDSYFLYPLGSTVPAPSFSLTPSRTINGFGGTIELGTGSSSKVNISAGVGLGQYVMDTDLATTATIPVELLERTEQSIDAHLKLAYPVGKGTISAGAMGGMNRLDSGEIDEEDNQHVAGGIRYRTLIGNGLELAIGAEILTISMTASTTRDATYIAPSLRVTLSPNPWVDLYALNSPEIVNNTLVGVTRQNPFILDQPLIEPTVFPINAETGVKIYSGPVRIVGRLGYRQSPNYSYFRRASASEINEGLTAFSGLSFADASILSGGGDVSVALPGRLSLTLGGQYQYAQFENSNDPIPYHAPVTGQAVISYNHMRSRFQVELGADYTGSRFVDRAESDELDGYVGLNLSAIYNVNSHLGVAVRAQNIFSDDLEAWENYLQSPIQFGAGLRFLW